MLHGGGQTRHAWDATATRLALAGFLAVPVDQRGHGDSPWVADQAYTFGHFAADASALARSLEASEGLKPALVGASLGGLAGMIASADAPDLFSALVLVDITPKMDPEGVASIHGFMTARSREGFASLEEAADAIAAYLPHRPRPKSLEGLRKNLRERDGRLYWHWDPSFMDGPGSVRVERDAMQEKAARGVAGAQCPVLLVRGRESELVGAREMRDFLALRPNAEAVDVAGARHMVAGDRNDVFAKTILDFLGRVAAG